MFMSVHKGEGGVKIVPNPVHVVCECPHVQFTMSWDKSAFMFGLWMKNLSRLFLHSIYIHSSDLPNFKGQNVPLIFRLITLFC